MDGRGEGPTDGRGERENVSNIWIDDGDLVILAGDKVFRLDRESIAQRTPLFEDLLAGFDISSIDDAGWRVIGMLGLDVRKCAVVRLKDKAEDVELFLSAIMDDNDKTHGSSAQRQYEDDLGTLIAILRLAIKYNVGFLQARACDRLQRLLPIDEDTLLGDVRTKGRHINGILSIVNLAAMSVQLQNRVMPRVYWRLHHAPLSQIMTHAEWSDLSETLRTSILLAHDAAHDIAVSRAAVIFRLQRENASTHQLSDECVREFTNTSMRVQLEHGVQGSGCCRITPMNARDLWEIYWSNSACDLCKETYEVARGRLVREAFCAVSDIYANALFAAGPGPCSDDDCADGWEIVDLL